MAYSCRKQTPFFRVKTLGFLSFSVFFLLTNCGLPSSGDIATPPFNINNTGFQVTFNLRDSHALAIYYQFISSGGTVEENFGNITTNGESVLSGRGYYRANDQEVYIWTPTTQTVTDPVTVTLTYATLGTDAKVTVTDAAGTVFFNNKILLRNSTLSAPNLGFSSPMPLYKDVGKLTSGPADIALAAISYKLNPVTMQLTPSVPQFLGYMRGLRIN